MNDDKVFGNWKDLKKAIEQMSESEQREPFMFQDMDRHMHASKACRIRKSEYGAIYIETCCEL